MLRLAGVTAGKPFRLPESLCMLGRRCCPPAVLALVLVRSAAADVSVPYDRFIALYRAAEVVHEPAWNDVRARPEAFRDRVISYQIQVKGRIDTPDESRLIGYTRKDEPLTVLCTGGCRAAALGAWVGVLGKIPDDGNPGHLVAAAVAQVRAPKVAQTVAAVAGSAVPSAAGEGNAANGAAGLNGGAADGSGGAVMIDPDGTKHPVGESEAPAAAPEPAAPPTAPKPTSEMAQRPRPAETQPANPFAPDAGALARLERFISSRNRSVGAGERRLIASEILKWAQYHGMRWEFFAAVITAESNFNRTAVSPAGALGLGQLMPFNLNAYGVGDPFDVSQNLYGSALYLRQYLDKYRNRDPQMQFQLTLACYNAGPGAVNKYGGVPPYDETLNYIRRVAGYYLRLCNETAAAG